MPTEFNDLDRGDPYGGIPWAMLTVGLGASILTAVIHGGASLLQLSLPPAIGVAQTMLILIGLLAMAIAIVNSPRSAVVLGAAALAVGTCTFSLPENWDTIIMAFRVATALAAFAAVLMASPRRIRRWAVSLAILFHFGGIATAVTSVPPPFGPAPWLTTQLWTRVYRPYFHFMYMYNAYHFYSPDPGPASVLWACLEYSNGSYHWVSVPNRQEHMKDPLALSYYRRLSLTESTNQLVPTNYISPVAMEGRRLAGLQLGIPAPERIAELMPTTAQNRLPNEYSQRMLKSYARFLVKNNPSADPDVRCTGIKIYRAYHVMVLPDQLMAGKDPTDTDLYWPYFQGEFDAEGNLKNPNDPLLYWLMPVLSVPQAPEPVRPSSQGSEDRPTVIKPKVETINCLELHAYANKGSKQP